MLIQLILTFLILVQGEEIIKLSFGSCFDYYRNSDSTAFKYMEQQNPNYFLWLGDAAYIDKMYLPGTFTVETDVKKIDRRFNSTKEHPDYKKFRQNHTIFGVYDDHDYNLNNGDKNHPEKEFIQQKYLDFIDVDENDDLRKQEGIYQKKQLDVNGYIMLILFDVRYFLDPLEQDVLGETQWKWFEIQLQNSTVKLFVLGSGFQFLPDDRFIPESWYQKSRERLFELIDKYKSNIVFISGDIHQTEILEYPCSKQKYGRVFYEYTSSGLNFGNRDIYPFYDFFHDWLIPSTYHMYPQYSGPNFGLLEFHINNSSIENVIFKAFDSLTGQLIFKHQQKYADMTYNPHLIDHKKQCMLDIPPQTRNRNHKISFISKNQTTFLLIIVSFLTISIIFLYIAIRWLKIVLKLYKNQIDL